MASQSCCSSASVLGGMNSNENERPPASRRSLISGAGFGSHDAIATGYRYDDSTEESRTADRMMTPTALLFIADRPALHSGQRKDKRAADLAVWTRANPQSGSSA